MTKETFMIEEISKDIVLLLMREHDMDMREAFRVLYTSDTYSRLIDLKTGLYAQSTAYEYRPFRQDQKLVDGYGFKGMISYQPKIHFEYLGANL